mmetsp:Transcript_17755/g.27183  ORF Transcript_17755/g.27183 Transcript_17755/m.27183 type:complete len:197 (+) Transcript_17755:119-709(+)
MAELVTLTLLRTSDAHRDKIQIPLSSTLNHLRDVIDNSSLGPLHPSRQRLFHLGRELKSGRRSLATLGLGRYKNHLVHVYRRPQHDGGGAAVFDFSCKDPHVAKSGVNDDESTVDFNEQQQQQHSPTATNNNNINNNGENNSSNNNRENVASMTAQNETKVRRRGSEVIDLLESDDGGDDGEVEILDEPKGKRARL